MKVTRSNIRRIVAAVVATGLAAGVFVTVATPASAKKLKVALIVVGTENDRSWSNAWSNGAKQAAKQFGSKIDLKIVGNVVQPDQFLAQGSAFGSQGYDLVIKGGGPTSFTPKDPIYVLAQKFPKTTWIYAPLAFPGGKGPTTGPSNLYFADIKQQDGSFRAGVLAGMLTKTNKLGAVNGFAFPALTRQPEGFVLGARCVNSKVQFVQKYINSWADTALASAAAKTMMQSGADFLFAAVDSASQGMFEAAKQKPGTYVIPSYFDDHFEAPSVVLTSVIYNLDKVGYDLIKRFVNHQLPPHWYHVYDFANFGVGHFAPFYNLDSAVTPAATAELAKVDAAIRAGKIKIPDVIGSPNIGVVGAGTKIPVQSIGCTPVR
ncbi:MAG TPA: BMP family ABC transporter substrate-binding protein [Gaiellaceae bacterium]|nr:BMP family ABC transporter substrate-binding protein [Gaiellaceae bacterium]